MVASTCFSQANDTNLSYDAITNDKKGKNRFLITFLLFINFENILLLFISVQNKSNKVI